MFADAKLVTFQNANGLFLDGLLFSSSGSNTTIVHVHGSYGNFYQNRFIKIMGDVYTSRGFNFLTFNLSSHDGFGDAHSNEPSPDYVGGAISKFEDCVVDIKAAIQEVSSFSNSIFLQGHSLGCERILLFLLETGEKYNSILLSPCDSYQLQSRWLAPETVEEQIVRLKNESPNDEKFDWVSSKEYGINQGGWCFRTPITRSALLSLLEGPAFKLIRLNNRVDYKIEVSTLIYIGGVDPIQTASHGEMFSFFEERLESVSKVFLPDGDHGFFGREGFIAHKVADWMVGLSVSSQ